MSVNVFLTRLEESGCAAWKIHMRVFAEMCHNKSSLCVCVFACHMQSELSKVEVSMTRVGVQERVALLVVWQQVTWENVCVCVTVCVCFLGGGVIFASIEPVPHVTYLCFNSLLSLTNYS